MAKNKTIARVVEKSNSQTTKPMKWIEIEKAIGYLQEKGLWHELLIIAVGAYTGYRINELLNLKYKDFQGDEINMKVSKQNKKQSDGTTKTTDIIRTVTIHSKIKGIVEKCRTELKRDLDSFLFVNSRYYSAEPLGRRAALSRIVSAFEAAGIERKILSAHGLRKTYALRKYEIYKEAYGDYAALNKVRVDLKHKSVAATREYIGVPESDEKQLDELAFN